MRVTKLSNQSDAKSLLHKIGVDGGGVDILASKMHHHIIHITKLHVGGANILKQDALSVGADLAVPRGTVVASIKEVDCILIATNRQLQKLAKKELAQPFGLKDIAKELLKISKIQEETKVEIMGIINANDDSFFSGSRFVGLSAVEKIQKMMTLGADIVDIGGVSSRPNAPVVKAKEELERVKPIIDALYDAKLYETQRFSIDSYEPSVISYALERGFDIVNDITGLENEAVCKLCAEYSATAITMHMKGTPQTMQNSPSYESVIDEVYTFLQNSILRAESLGVKDIVVDVGIGFGKTLEHNLALIKHLEHFLTLQRKILVGASRKSMLNEIYPSSVEERLPATLAIHLEALRGGASILRVHDVEEHKRVVEVFEALKRVEI
jgi:dihydropteroate synthase